MSRKKNKRPADASSPTSSSPGELPPDAAGDSRAPLDKQRDRDAMQLIKKMRSELGASGGFVTLERRNPMFNMMKFAGLGVQIDITELSIEYVATTFGGGDYIARGRTRGGTFEHEQRIEFTIDHTIPPKNPLAGSGKETPAAPAAVDATAIMREARESAKAETSALAELAKAAMASRQDQGPAMNMLKFMFEAQQKAEERHAAALAKSEERFNRLIAEMRESRTVEAPKSIREQIEEAKDLIDLIGGKGGGDGDKDPFWKDIGRGLGEVVIPIIKEKFAGAGGPVIPGPAAPRVAAIPSTPAPASLPAPQPQQITAASAETGATAAEGDEMRNPFITAALGRFRVAALDAARKNKDPFEFVDNLIGMVPESYHGMIFNTANASNWFSQIFGADQDAVNHAPFLGEVRNSILAKAFIAHAQRSAAGGADAADTAKTFFEWVTKDFDDSFSAMAEEPEDWSAAFEGIAIDAGWLEQLRKAVVEALEPDTDGKVTPLPTVTARAEPSAPATQPKKEPAPKKTRAARS